MEPEKHDIDYNEIDKLLREIPDAIAGSPCTGERIQSSRLPSSEPISSSSLCDLFKAVNIGDSNFVNDTLVYETPLDQVDSSRNYDGASPRTYHHDTSKLHDKSLALDWKDLGLKDGVAINSANHFFQDNQSLFSFNDPFSLDQLESAKMSVILPAVLTEVNLPNLVDHSLYVTKKEPCEPNRHSRIVDGYNDAEPTGFNFHHRWGPSSDHQVQRQSFPPCLATMPVDPELHTFFPPALSPKSLELQPSPFQQQHCNESSYSATVHHQRLGQSSMLRCDDRRHHQCPQVKMQRSIDQRTGWVSENAAMCCFRMPIASQAEQVSLNPYEESNNHAEYHDGSLSSQHRSMHLRRGQSSPLACTSIVSNAHHIFERFGKQIFPDEILTRSHGLASLQVPTFGTVGNIQWPEHVNNTWMVTAGSSQFPEHVSNTWRVIPNSNVHNHLAQPDRSFNLDDRRRQGYYSDNYHYPKISRVSPNTIFQKNRMSAKSQRNWNSLQSLTDEGNREEFDKIFPDDIEYVIELITDPSGNYLAQKLVEFCTEEQLTRIIHSITRSSGELVKISCSEHGTRVVQKIIETIKDSEQYSMIVSALKPDIISLIKNNNGCHVAMHCLQYLSPKYRELLFENVVSSCIELAKDRHGCCVIQRCVTNLNEDQKVQLIYKLASKTCELSEDPFGNYALQFVIDQGIPWATAKILDKMEGHYQSLSVQKHSSHVVEKCLKIASDERRAGIIRELIQEPQFRQIVLDPFGNYVIQSALVECKGKLRAALNHAIKQHEPALRVKSYGKRILSNAWYAARKQVRKDSSSRSFTEGEI